MQFCIKSGKERISKLTNLKIRLEKRQKTSSSIESQNTRLDKRIKLFDRAEFQWS